GFGKCSEAKLTGIWRRDQVAAAQNCAEYWIPHCFPTREALCSSPDIDVVLITSPDAMHWDDTLLALRFGKAVLCEKPVAMNAAEAEEMQAAARAAGLLYGVAQNFRFNRSLEWMRDQIAAERIGEPQFAHAQYSYPATQAPRKWIADPKLACGGPIADVGVHCIDALRAILQDDPQRVTVLARSDAASAPLDCAGTLGLEFSSGLAATVIVSSRAPYRTPLEIVGS